MKQPDDLDLQLNPPHTNLFSLVHNKNHSVCIYTTGSDLGPYTGKNYNSDIYQHKAFKLTKAGGSFILNTDELRHQNFCNPSPSRVIQVKICNQ